MPWLVRPRGAWLTRVYFSRMLHGRGVCRLAPPAAVAALIGGSGDAISQLVIEARAEVDAPRLLTCACLGSVIDGAILQRWYAKLQRLELGRGASALLGRLLLHHAVFAPAFAIPAFIAATNSTGARDSRAAAQKLRREWRPAARDHLLVVGPGQLANACGLVSKSHAVLWANLCQLLWATALSWRSHRPDISR
ncbi:hypothetical protein EMIHUDRAFT_195657 [Emiliania huxleyi CCMP1516]|uniref:Uncharacterized protein n=3 Tax=Emiliania huxleyi TaxID=2903 RepID=A0A0D3JHV0_EMIH1|nr:hypothetical protein EMIHUDRAFT_195657 [Emiliania huxleyi CCMP1516]EOD23085.1 hypothetical protein EMIHUDRAFT_195657 [Emiliania huxleyi CCMP1516]|eukprot:XP_005775514.1 hypothetical protein EMIHUDRAFT_195657 [Emiliania huxleyi CCMP1516]